MIYEEHLQGQITDNRVGDSLSGKIQRTVVSTLVFVIAFLLSNLLLQGTTALVGKALSFTVAFKYGHVTIGPFIQRYWSFNRVLALYLLPPLLCLAISGYLLFLQTIILRSVNMLRFCAFWFMVCLVNMVLAHLVFAPVGVATMRGSDFFQSFAVVGSWLNLNAAALCFPAVAALALSVLTGIKLRNMVLKYSFSARLIKTEIGKRSVILQVYLLPVIIGSLPLLLLCRNSGFGPTLVTLVNFIIICSGMFIRNEGGRSKVNVDQRDILNHPPFTEAIVCALLWGSIYWFLT